MSPRSVVGRWRPRTAVVPEALAFLDPIDRICEERAPRLLCLTHVVAASLFATLLVLAAVVRVDVVVIGTGRLTTDTAPIVLQPMERAILRDMRVKPGDVVTRGQVLATLDPTFARADEASVSGQLRALQSQQRRLEAEAAGTTFTAREATPENSLQLALHHEREAEYRSRLRVFDEECERLRAQLAATEADRAGLLRQLDVSRSVEQMRETLMAHQTGSKLQYLDAMAARLRAERELVETSNRLPQLQHGLQSKLSERQGFVEAWRREISETLVATRAEAAKLGEALAKAARLNDLVVVTAPEDGVVLEVAQRSGGSVLREAEPLVTITPSHAELIAEVMIGSRDTGYLVPNARAEVKVDAFPYQRHGVLQGRLLSVSEESVSGPGGADAFHRGRIELSAARLSDLPPGSRPYPGMTVTAELKVGSRRALSYFLSPITRGLQESLREP